MLSDEKLTEISESLNALSQDVHALAKQKGWYEPPKTFGEAIAMTHSELSEALDAYSHGAAPNMVYYETAPEGVAIELADVLIRVLDICAYYEIDIGQAVKVKHTYNKSRPIRHGGKVL